MGRTSTRRLRRIVASVGAIAAVLTLAPAAATAVAAPPEQVRCELPTTGNPTTARPDQVGMDAAALADAIGFAASRNRVNVQVYRNNCLVGAAPQNAFTGNIPWQQFSVTKSVVSMLTGIAVTRGQLGLDDPIGDYLEPGLGDAAHRAITVRQLLTETSGMQEAVLSEIITGSLDLDPDIVAQGLAAPLVREPGTYFQYAQHVPDILARVVERAVGEDLQDFAQQNLFGPIGIEAGDYYWARDRSGNTYGYSYFFLPPNDLARLGLLMVNDGQWNGLRIISSDYVREASSSSPANACYGFLFWTNGTPCTGDSIPYRRTLDLPRFPGMPADAYGMIGLLGQNVFVVPSLDLVVTWNGVAGDISPDPFTALGLTTNSELNHGFFRRLVPAFTDVALPDPGPYVPTPNTQVRPEEFLDLNIFLTPFGLGPQAIPGCSVLACGPEPLRAPFSAAPPGCALIACVPISPLTPIRADPGPGPVA